MGCYLDFQPLDIYDPEGVVIESTFFLESPVRLHAVHGRLNGLFMRYNTWSNEFGGANNSIELIGAFLHPEDVDISDSHYSLGKGVAKTTRARASLYQENATRWSFNFSEQLLFPEIDQVIYSVVSDVPVLFQHVARTPQNATVVVETSAAVKATVTVEVMQAL